MKRRHDLLDIFEAVHGGTKYLVHSGGKTKKTSNFLLDCGIDCEKVGHKQKINVLESAFQIFCKSPM